MPQDDTSRRINEQCDRFEAAWKSASAPRIEDHLDSDISDPRRLLIELLMLDLEYRWRSAGHLPTSDAEAESFPSRPRVADYVARYPLLGPIDQLPDELLAEEYRARRRWGDCPGPEEYLREFGAQRPDLSGLLRQVDAELASGHETEPGENVAAAPESHEVNALPNGTKIRYFGDYELLEKLGEGGMGVVYKARQASLQRIVALKMIKRGQLASEEEVERFHNEAQAAAKLDHRGIVPVFEVGEHEGQHYFSMGYVEGQSLSQEVAQGPFSQRRAAELMQKVADAVAYAHSQGVIHRDLKPANILVGHDGEPRVTDFGLAKRLDSDSGLTVVGGYMGTPSYMPPEQALGRMDQVDQRSDVYSLGATLYHLLTGHPPFQGATGSETRILVRTAEPVAPRVLNPAVHRDIETICLKCLEKDTSQRYSSADDFREDLRRFLNYEPTVARPLGRPQRLLRWCRRYPLVAMAGIATLLLLAWTAQEAYEQSVDSVSLIVMLPSKPPRLGPGSPVACGSGAIGLVRDVESDSNGQARLILNIRSEELQELNTASVCRVIVPRAAAAFVEFAPGKSPKFAKRLQVGDTVHGEVHDFLSENDGKGVSQNSSSAWPPQLLSHPLTLTEIALRHVMAAVWISMASLLLYGAGRRGRREEYSRDGWMPPKLSLIQAFTIAVIVGGAGLAFTELAADPLAEDPVVWRGVFKALYPYLAIVGVAPLAARLVTHADLWACFRIGAIGSAAILLAWFALGIVAVIGGDMADSLALAIRNAIR